MTNVIDRQAADKIQVFFPFSVINTITSPFYNKEGKPLIRVHYIFPRIPQIPHLLSLEITPEITTMKNISYNINALKNQLKR